MPKRKLAQKDVEHSSFLYSNGGSIDVLARDLSVSPAGLRKAIRKLNGGKLPRRNASPPCTGAMQDALNYLEGLRAALAAVEPNPQGYTHLHRLDAACRAVRTALEQANTACETMSAAFIMHQSESKETS